MGNRRTRNTSGHPRLDTFTDHSANFLCPPRNDERRIVINVQIVASLPQPELKNPGKNERKTCGPKNWI
jgi:hypothetical protein